MMHSIELAQSLASASPEEREAHGDDRAFQVTMAAA